MVFRSVILTSRSIKNYYGIGVRKLTQLAGRGGLVEEEITQYPLHLEGYTENLPSIIHVDGLMKNELASYTKNSKPEIIQRLLQHGAVLFRGLPLDTSMEFSDFFAALGYKPKQDVGGSATRPSVAPNVIESSYERPERCIEPHLETAFYSVYPYLFILFAEVAPPPGTGGESGVTDMREVLNKLDKEVLEKFKRKGICYHRYLPDINSPEPKHHYGFWQKSFGTESREEAEEILRASGHSPDQYHWDNDGALRFQTKRPILTPHVKTGEMMWFNQITNSHWTYFKNVPDVYSMLKGQPPCFYPVTCTYGDGEEIEPEVVRHVRVTHWSCTRAEQLQSKDVLILDNMRVGHSRLSFTGERKFTVALTGEPY